MNRLLPLLSLILSVIIFFTYSACTEIVVESKMTEKEVSSLEMQSKPEEPPIVIDAFPCDTRIEETYEFHHYHPI